MNDDKEDKNTHNDNDPSSNGGNKVTYSGSGGGVKVNSDLQFSSMGPNYNNNQFHSGNSQHPGHHIQDNLTKIGTGSPFIHNNDHSNDGISGNNRNQLNNVNGISNGNASSNNLSSEVCRDFLRNVCRRGANCRYRHPEGSEAEELGKKVDLIFCHDYQNKECRRSNCRFIHCTKQEEEIYRATGKLPTHLIEKSYSRLAASLSPSPTLSSASFHHQHQQHQQQQIPLHQSQHHQQQTDFIKSFVCDNSNINGLTNPSITSNLASSFVSSLPSVASSSSVAYSSFPPSIPVCKDNLKGDCLRGLRCKFRHISQAEYDLELRSAATHSSSIGVRPSPMDRNQSHVPSHPGNIMDGSTAYQGGLTPPEPKRRAYDASLSFPSQPPLNHNLPPPLRITSSFNHQGLSSIQSSSNDFEFSKPPLPPSQATFNSRLEDENFTLRRHIEELKKQVANLMATNEFLMEQNAQLRTLGNRATTPLPPPLHQSPTSAPQLSLSNELFTGSRSNDHLYPHQLPVALAASLNAQTTGSIPVSSMAALSTNVISNSTNPLISYPLMAATIQSLRPPIIPHSLSH